MTHYDDAKETFRCEHGRVRGAPPPRNCPVCEPVELGKTSAAVDPSADSNTGKLSTRDSKSYNSNDLASPGSPWRPIAEAPKDGTVIVAYDDERVETIYWKVDKRYVVGGAWNVDDGVHVMPNPIGWLPSPLAEGGSPWRPKEDDVP